MSYRHGGEGIDLLAFAGHKVTYGPHSTGGLVVRPGIPLETWVEGGPGVKSALETLVAAPPVCQITNVNALGEKMRLHVDGVRAKVEGDRREEPQRCFRSATGWCWTVQSRSTSWRRCVRGVSSGVR